MGVARAALLEPLEEIPFPVTRQALVVGGGLAGMTAALAIADSGFKVTWWKKAKNWEGWPGESITPWKATGCNPIWTT